VKALHDLQKILKDKKIEVLSKATSAKLEHVTKMYQGMTSEQADAVLAKH
jgi:hypothetical protein